MTLIVCHEGSDGTGKSKHTDLLAKALNAEGVNAATWRHLSPPVWPNTPWSNALWYARCRESFAADVSSGLYGDTRVIVCDRWLWSTAVAAGVSDHGHGPRFALAAAELVALPPVHTILLTAPVEVIAARLRARPEEVPDNLARAQGHYVALAVAHGWPVVNTDRDAAEVTRDLVAIVRRLLTAQGVCPTTEGL